MKLLPLTVSRLSVVVVFAVPTFHPIHTTVTVIKRDATGHALNVSVRAFADDFSAAVARFAGRPSPVDSSAPLADVIRYVQAKVEIRDARGTTVPLVSCGMTRVRELYWLCFTVALKDGARSLSVRNQLLTELHADQVNIIQLERGRDRSTLLFTRGSAARPVAP